MGLSIQRRATLEREVPLEVLARNLRAQLQWTEVLHYVMGNKRGGKSKKT